MASVKELNLRDMKLRDLIRLASLVVRELERRLESETQIFDKYAGFKDCSVTVTWVKNKRGHKYYYPYLKCKSSKPKSIYLGNKIVLERMISMYKSLKRIVRHRDQIIQVLDKALGVLGDVEMIVEAAREMREAEKQAIKDQALLEKSRSRRRRGVR